MPLTIVSALLVTMEMRQQAGPVLSAGPTVLQPTLPPIAEASRTVCVTLVIMAAVARVLPLEMDTSVLP